MTRRLPLVVAFTIVFAGAAVRPVAAATFAVDTAIDAADASPGDGVCAKAGGGCTLRAAVEEANALAGADAITLPAGVYALGSGLAVGFGQPLTVTGAGAAVTIVDGASAFRVFDVSFTTFAISGVTIRHGKATSGCGGGLRSFGGTVTITDSAVVDNTSSNQGGGGLCNTTQNGVTATMDLVRVTVAGNSAQTYGGGILNNAHDTVPPLLGGVAHLSLTDCLVEDNTAANGGGIATIDPAPLPNTLADLGVVTSTIRDNQAQQAGGGMYASFSLLSFDQSTISGNTARDGAGLACSGVPATVSRSTISGNAATRNGGGLEECAGTFDDSTISGNSSREDGGGVHGPSAHNASLQLRGVTIAGNTADADGNGTGDGGGVAADAVRIIEVTNTLIGDNQDLGGESPDCRAELLSHGHALIENPAGCLLSGDLTGNVAGLDPALAPLAANGGPTLTHALLAGSPATDAGSACAATDQRGTARPQGPGCDIGAFEAVYAPTACGNGALDGGEACDDGNVRDGDCCSHTCQLEAVGAPCSDGDPCTDDACDGAGTCVHSDNTAPCSDGSVCTVGDVCASGACVSGAVLDCDDGYVCSTDTCDPTLGCHYANAPPSTPCDDGNACTVADHCSFGLCRGDGSFAGPCDDGTVCTTGDHCQSGACVHSGALACAVCDYCDAVAGCVTAPVPGCRELDAPHASRVQIKDGADDKDSLEWTWQAAGGTTNDLRLFDNRNFELCVFDESGGVPSVALHARNANVGNCGPSPEPCWKDLGRGAQYRDKSGSADGLTRIHLLATPLGTGLTKLKVKGKGAALMTPSLPLAQSPQVTIQLRHDSGPCWVARYHTAVKNDAIKFQARSD